MKDVAEATQPPAARRLGKRETATVERILDGAVRALHRRGARKLQISEVCTQAGVSRGTLYRHFPTKDDLLSAVSVHLRERFERALIAALAGAADPKARLHETMVFMARHVENQRLDLPLEVEPDFVLQSVRGNYSHYVRMVRRELETAFAAMEAETGRIIDRAACVEIISRTAYSVALLPGVPAWLNRPNAAEQTWRMFCSLQLGDA